jgi:geranylgeranyl diphosphate synthase, type II
MMASLTVKKALAEFVNQLVGQIERELDHRLGEATLAENLREAVRYAVLGGGKRLRPALVILCCEALGGQRRDAYDAACAMELIHCFSLVHDDLPAMDDDDLRRGRPTLHIHAGEAMAILAGDVMVSLAFEFLSRAPVAGDVKARLIAELAQSTTGMINGQVYDTLGGFDEAISEQDRLHLIHRNKTGALLRASCRMGAMCGGATPAQLDDLTRFGDAMGLMFQIVDDLLDVTQSAEHIGKATGKDHAAGKITFPGVMGIDVSRREVERLREESHRALASLGSAAQPLHDVCDEMAVRTK